MSRRASRMRERSNPRTFSPRNNTSPDEGSISRRMHRPVVLLPLPDSPTRPNISPSSIVKLTSSTARTTDGGQEPSRVLVRRFAEDLAYRPLFDQPALVHHRHAVGHFGHDAEVVRNEQHGQVELLLQIAQQLEDLRLDR